jgi:hypothetical protein
LRLRVVGCAIRNAAATKLKWGNGMKSAKRKGRPQGARAERVPPTAETVVKLKPNYLWELDPQYQAAAIGIAAGFRIIAGKVQTKTSRLATHSNSTEGEPVKASPIPREQQLEEIEQRYTAWRDRVLAAHLPLREVLDMIVEGAAPWRVDKCHGWQEGRAAEFLVSAVSLYSRG